MKPLIAWSYGGGVQSVALAVLISQGKLQRPDLAVIADTGREAETTWTYLRETTTPLLRPLDVQIQIAPHTLATVDLYSTNGALLIPAWTDQSGKTGRLPTYCSVEWKRRVVRRWLRQQGVKKCELWLGISLDETHRAKDSDVAWLRHEYPLLDLMLRRRDCERIIVEAGLPVPAKSSCWMCPHRGMYEWAALTPGDTAKAKAFEAEIRKRDQHISIYGPRLTSQENDACDSGFCWT